MKGTSPFVIGVKMTAIAEATAGINAAAIRIANCLVLRTTPIKQIF